MEVVDRLIDKLARSCDEYEIVRKVISKTNLKVEKATVEDFKEATEIQYSLRIIKDKKVGFTYFTKIDNIDTIVDRAVSLSNYAEPDKLNRFYNNEFKEGIFELFNEDIEKIDFDKMYDFAAQLEEKTYKRDKRITKVKDAGFFKGKVTVDYVNSNNISKAYTTNYCGASVVALASENSSNMMGYEYVAYKNFDFFPEDIANSVANKAVRMLNAKKGSSLLVPVIFENELVGDILSIIAPSFYIENIVKNKSLFRNFKKGDKVASEVFNLIDDATDNRYIGAALFDDEGTPTNKKILIQNGYLNEFLYNYYYAQKENIGFSGNGFLSNFKSYPSITHTNLILKPTENSLKEFIKSLNSAILLTNLMGLHMADPISGEFSLGAEGVMIRDGELKEPVKEMVINGNITDILKNCKMIFNDIKVAGSIGSPSILVEGLKIVGN
jgi:PmbA protein